MKFILFMVACGLFQTAHAQELKLALNWKPEPQFGGFYAAQSGFAKEKLNIKILEGGSGTPTIQMVAAGTAEYAVISGDELVIAHARGSKDVVALFATYQVNPQAIMTHSEKKYASIESVLKDGSATLLWQSGLPYAQFLMKKYAPVKVKQGPTQGGIGAFMSDKNIAQQCFFTSEPLTAKKQKVNTNTLLVADTGYNPYTTVLVTLKSRLEKHPKEVAQVVKAVREGWQQYIADPTKTNELMQKLNPSMAADTFKASAESQKSLIVTDETKKSGLGSMTLERWDTLVNQLADLSVIKEKPVAKDLFVNL